MIYVAFSASWEVPPGDVMASFATREEAEHYCYELWDGYGYSVVEVPEPSQTAVSRATTHNEPRADVS